jgi:hypothetical protein
MLLFVIQRKVEVVKAHDAPTGVQKDILQGINRMCFENACGNLCNYLHALRGTCHGDSHSLQIMALISSPHLEHTHDHHAQVSQRCLLFRGQVRTGYWIGNKESAKDRPIRST